MENKVTNNQEDVLKVIPNDQLLNLRNLFKIDWPSHVHIYNFIDTVIKMKKKNDKYVTLYCPDGNWQDGTIVGVVSMVCYDVVVYSLDKNLTRLLQALAKTNVIDWQRKMIFPSVRMEFTETLMNSKKERAPPFIGQGPSYIWWLPKEKALQYEYSVPPEYYVGDLHTSHADVLNAEWPHKHPGSEKYLAKLIEVNGGIGLFSKETNNLCAWSLKSYLGAIGVLQVATDYKRRGLGSLITKIMSKKLAEEGLDSIGCVVLHNYISQKMFSKLGFEKKIAVAWLFDIPI